MKAYRWILLVLAFLVFASGGYLLLFPSINQYKQKNQSDRIIKAFYLERSKVSAVPTLLSEHDETEETAQEGQPGLPHAGLLGAMQAYNAAICKNGQVGLADPWAYTAEVLDLSCYGLETDAVGVLEIPKLDLREPVYLGATQAHLDNGIAQLSISSMPIGGVNTNCVLAGHRGWNGAQFFRHIELLEIDDEVTLTNFWESLHYRVTEIRIIQPYQAEEILIQPGRDLLTLISCHPYGSGGRYRYVVYCERIEP